MFAPKATQKSPGNTRPGGEPGSANDQFVHVHNSTDSRSESGSHVHSFVYVNSERDANSPGGRENPSSSGLLQNRNPSFGAHRSTTESEGKNTMGSWAHVKSRDGLEFGSDKGGSVATADREKGFSIIFNEQLIQKAVQDNQKLGEVLKYTPEDYASAHGGGYANLSSQGSKPSQVPEQRQFQDPTKPMLAPSPGQLLANNTPSSPSRINPNAAVPPAQAGLLQNLETERYNLVQRFVTCLNQNNEALNELKREMKVQISDWTERNEASKNRTIANETGRDSEKEFNIWELEQAVVEVSTLHKNNQQLIRTFQNHLNQGNVLQNRAVRLQALASLFTQNNEKIAKFEKVLRDFKERAHAWIFEKEMLRLVEDRNSMFGTPKAVLDFLLIEAKNLIEDETERKDIEQQLRENVEATVEEGEAHSTLGWNNTIRRIMRLYEKYGDSLPPLEELGQWNASGSMAEGGRSSNSPDVERNAPESQSCNVVSGPGSYWDP